MNHVALNTRRLRTARKLTQGQLAKQAGVSRPTIVKLEDPSATTRPSMRTLQSVADALLVDVSELFKNFQLPTRVRFRALNTFKSREQVLIDALSAYDTYMRLEEAAGERLEPDAGCDLETLKQGIRDFQGSTRDRAVHAANLVRERLGLPGHAPIHQITSVIERIGVRVLSIPYTAEAFGLTFESAHGHPIIAINTSDKITVERWIFTAAHELGHVLLHWSKDDSFAESTEDQANENEANFFAAELLMPQEAFDTLWPGSYASEGDAPTLLVQDTLFIKRIFAMSYQSVLYRVAAKTREDVKALQKKFRRGYEMLYGVKLKVTEEGHAPADWKKYDPSIVPVTWTSEEPENIGAGSPHLGVTFPQGRAMRLLVKAIEQHKVTTAEVADYLHTSREIAQAFEMQVRDL